MLPNNALERTVRRRGPRLAAARPAWPAAKRDRWVNVRNWPEADKEEAP